MDALCRHAGKLERNTRWRAMLRNLVLGAIGAALLLLLSAATQPLPSASAQGLSGAGSQSTPSQPTLPLVCPATTIVFSTNFPSPALNNGCTAEAYPTLPLQAAPVLLACSAAINTPGAPTSIYSGTSAAACGSVVSVGWGWPTNPLPPYSCPAWTGRPWPFCAWPNSQPSG